MDSDPEECFVDQLDTPFNEISISVVEGVPRGSGMSGYIGYIIRMTNPKQIVIERRYSEFSALREVLIKRWPGVLIPPLPGKHSSGNKSLKVVNQRIKYLTFFLNNCVKQSYIFMSQQFQLFLTSSDPDLRRVYEKMRPLPYLLLLNRYQKAFPDTKAVQSRKGELLVLTKDQLQPFLKQLQNQHIALINLKRQIFKLASRRDEYLRTTRVLFGDSLPNLEAHLTRTTESPSLVLVDNQQAKDHLITFKQFNAKNYWLIYETLKLEILEAQAMIDAIQSRINLGREEQRCSHELRTNEEQLISIQAKKLTLKQFFSRNNQELTRELQEKNKIIRVEMESLRTLNLIVAQISTTQLVENYYIRRQELWRNTFANYVSKQKYFNSFLEAFFLNFLKR